jgi:hypothetical protein
MKLDSDNIAFGQFECLDTDLEIWSPIVLSEKVQIYAYITYISSLILQKFMFQTVITVDPYQIVQLCRQIPA